MSLNQNKKIHVTMTLQEIEDIWSALNAYEAQLAESFIKGDDVVCERVRVLGKQFGLLRYPPHRREQHIAAGGEIFDDELPS